MVWCGPFYSPTNHHAHRKFHFATLIALTAKSLTTSLTVKKACGFRSVLKIKAWFFRFSNLAKFRHFKARYYFNRLVRIKTTAKHFGDLLEEPAFKNVRTANQCKSLVESTLLTHQFDLSVRLMHKKLLLFARFDHRLSSNRFSNANHSIRTWISDPTTCVNPGFKSKQTEEQLWQGNVRMRGGHGKHSATSKS